MKKLLFGTIIITLALLNIVVGCGKEKETVQEASPFPNCKLVSDACETGTIASISQYAYSREHEEEFVISFERDFLYAEALMNLCDGKTAIFSQPDDIVYVEVNDKYTARYIPSTHIIAIEGPDNKLELTGRALVY